MKKLFFLILALLHITTSTGVVVRLHYCTSELEDWGRFNKESTMCGKCGMQEQEGVDNGCCRDELKIIKNETEQKITEILVQLLNVSTQALPATFCKIPPSEGFAKIKKTPISRALLKTSCFAVYMRNCVFLI